MNQNQNLSQNNLNQNLSQNVDESQNEKQGMNRNINILSMNLQINGDKPESVLEQLGKPLKKGKSVIGSGLRYGLMGLASIGSLVAVGINAL